MPTFVKSGGVWKEITSGSSVKSAGVWKTFAGVFVKQSGTWKQSFVPYAPIPPLTYSNSLSGNSARSGLSITTTSTSSPATYAEWRYNVTTTTGSLTGVTNFGNGNTGYEAFVTVTSGSLTGGTTGSWVACSNGGTTWYVDQTTTGSKNAVISVQIRRTDNAQVVQSFTVSLTATRA